MVDELKEEIRSERDQLRDENDNLRAEIARLREAGAGVTAVGRAQVQHTFLLTEGDRLELEQRGVANINGRLMTRDEVLDKLAHTGAVRTLPDGREQGDQSGVEIGEVAEGADQGAIEAARKAAHREAVYGVDYIYPSVAPGVIDPAVAGQSGINGPERR